MCRIERYSTVANQAIRLSVKKAKSVRVGLHYAGVARHTDVHQMEFWIFSIIFTKSQVAALLVTFIITLVPAFLYSGLLAPVSNIAEVTKVVAQGFPAMYFLQIAVGTFNKGIGPADFITEYLVLFGFAALFFAAGVLLLKKQKS